MKNSMISIRAAVALMMLPLVPAALVASPPAAAQSIDPNDRQDSGIDYPRRPAAQTSPSGSTNGDQASSAQVQSSGDNRYRPDQIDSTGGTRRVSEGDEQEAKSEGGVTAQETVVRPRPAPPNEFEAYVSELADKPLRRFGANLLVPSARDYTAPPTTAVPSDYRINPGDEIVIGLSGSVNAENLQLKVDPDGRIFVPRVGPINVAGVRYGQLQSLIAARVSRQYRSFRISVTIGQLHGLTVYVTGFAQTPGSYTVSSLSTLVNAVLAAGGPSAGGSFRSIQLRRGGKLISDFDLYDFLLKGDKAADASLQNGDVIFIAPVGAQVAVIGSVNNEAVFEARPGDSLTDVLIYAGGVNTVADDTRLLVLDPLSVSDGWQQLTPQEAGTRTVKRAQVLRVLSGVGIARPLALQPVLVTLNGEVNKPGRYYVAAGTSIEEIIRRAGGLTPDAFPYGTVFTRESLRLQQRLSYERALRDAQFMLTAQPLTSVASINQDQLARIAALRALVAQLEERKPDGRLVLEVQPTDQTVPGDLVLENNDTLYVPPRPVTVGVFGSVPSPASFRYRPGAKIGEYVLQAGGVQKIGDRSEIFVVRANGTLLAPRRGVFRGSVLSAPSLPGDLIYVPINPSRGAFWARLRDITQVLFQGALSAATVVAATK